MKNLLRTAIILLLFGGCYPKIISYSAKDDSPLENSHELLNYYLPKSYLKVRVPINVNVLDSGILHEMSSDNAREFIDNLKINYGWEPATVPTKYTFGSKIQFIPQTVPDPDKYYSIAYKKFRLYSQNLKINLNKDGIISSGEFAQKDKTFEVVSKGLELGATLASKFYSLGGFKNIESSDSSELKRLKLLINELESLSAARYENATKALPGVSKESIEFRMKNIDERISAIKKEILGSKKTTTNWVSFYYVPGKATTRLLTLNTVKGIVSTNAVVNDQLAGLVEPEEEEGKNQILKIEARKIIDVPDTSLVVKQKKEKAFLRYNIAPKYELKLLMNGKSLKSYSGADDKNGTEIYSMYFPQFGVVGTLPADFSKANVVYYEDIGGIKSLDFSKDPIETSEVESVFAALDSLNSLRETRKAYLKAKEDKKNGVIEEEEPEEVEETVIRIIFGEKESDEDNDTSGTGG